MNDLAISVDKLGKCYRIGKAAARSNAQRSIGQKLTDPFSSLIGMVKRPEPAELFWALSEVSFDVNHGEVVGLVGGNGAGKSTLLKILSRITEPTEGRAVINGRVGSLLEVGTGFHPELTGRENIYLSGAILGMKRAEIDRKFDEIVAFAEVAKFLETPVKRYSSGMYVRLAFAVAANLDPEVLLVDEVLAVGDVAFQKKCLGKMSDVSQRGKTVLFVSHNMIAVQNLCQRVIWLQDGRVRANGPTSEVLRQYLAASSSAQNERSWDDPDSAPGNEKVRLRRVCIRPEQGTPTDLIGMSMPLVVEVEYVNLAPGAHVHACLHVMHEQTAAFVTASNETDATTRNNPLPAGYFRSVCRIPGDLLNAGVHSIMVLFRQNGRKVILRCENAITFEVLELEERPGLWPGRAPGAVHPRLSWDTAYLGPSGDVQGSDMTASSVSLEHVTS
jgi:lipopolysaccharide transport system ATP-binding protein